MLNIFLSFCKSIVNDIRNDCEKKVVFVLGPPAMILFLRSPTAASKKVYFWIFYFFVFFGNIRLFVW